LKLNEEQWKLFVKNNPIYAIDIVVFSHERGVLLGKRINDPAKGKYFVPGGRVFKDENRENAFNRICKEEINIDLNFKKSSLIGIYEHFYNNSKWTEEIFSTHYIVEARLIKINPKLENDINIDNQHSKRLWLKNYFQNQSEIHSYCKPYFQYLNLK